MELVQEKRVAYGSDPYIARGKSAKLNVGGEGRGEEAIISQFIPVARGSERCTMPLPCSCVVHGGGGEGGGMREREGWKGARTRVPNASFGWNNRSLGKQTFR